MFRRFLRRLIRASTTQVEDATTDTISTYRAYGRRRSLLANFSSKLRWRRNAPTCLKIATPQDLAMLPICPQQIKKQCEATQAKLGFDPLEKDLPTSLMEAAQTGRLETLRSLHSQFPDLLRFRLMDRTSALHFAAEGGCVKCVEQLIAYGLNPFAERTIDGWTALHFAASRNHCAIVSSLLASHPVLAYEADRTGLRPIHYAAAGGSLESLHRLMGYESKAGTLMDIPTPLMAAATVNNVKALQTINRRFPTMIEQKDRHGNTALHLAAAGGHLAAVKALMTYNTLPPHNPEEGGATAFYTALLCGQRDVAVHIYDMDQSVMRVPDSKGYPPLISLAEKDKLDMVAFLVVVMGEDPIECRVQETGATALMIAAASSSMASAEWLVKRERRLVDVRDKEGLTALHYAAKSNSKEMESIIQKAAQCSPKTGDWALSLNAPKTDRETRETTREREVIAATERGDLPYILKLSETGFNVTLCRTPEGIPLVGYAAALNQVDLLEGLGKHFGDSVLEGELPTGEKYSDLAAASGAWEALKFLLFRKSSISRALFSDRRQSAFRNAVRHDQAGIVQLMGNLWPYLLHERTPENESIVMFAAWNGSYRALLMLFDLSVNFSEELVNEKGQTILMAAAKSDCAEMADWILSQFPDLLNVRDPSRRNAFYYAVEGNSRECLEVFRIHAKGSTRLSIEGHDTTERGHTLMTLAAEKNLPKMVNWLGCHNRLLVTAPNAAGMTPLKVAIACHSQQCMETLWRLSLLQGDKNVSEEEMSAIMKLESDRGRNDSSAKDMMMSTEALCTWNDGDAVGERGEYGEHAQHDMAEVDDDENIFSI